ncbi:ovarian cancer-associated 2 protein-like [Tropilaelaps mercedesae]|uniref:Ovarian cancer-associated 2 protein-like n=1 Tax=Tropilaelaps mercedesae TaxID=418985 RepID=A0A1V9XPK1_9ACAR|nr:ovarian cancer-associated 2 protein-like [Tropilaelaps mercedesae]
MSVRKLRILCLHGYQQNAATFRLKCGGFRKKIRALAELVFLDAPLVIDGDPEKRGWIYKDENSMLSNCSEDPTGLQKSLDAVGAVVEREGPFDGMFAFSQGASFAALLLHLLQKPQSVFIVNPKIKFKFVVLACGAESRIHQFEEPIDIPSLHLIGITDQVRH